MIIDEETKLIQLRSDDLERGNYCPECGEFYKPNGTGPSNNKRLAWFLKHLPSNGVLGGQAPRFHDWAFLLCPEGWTLEYSYKNKFGQYTKVIAKDFQSANNAYFTLQKAQIEDKCNWYSKPFYYTRAEINYKAVTGKTARNSFKHKH